MGRKFVKVIAAIDVHAIGHSKGLNLTKP